MDAPIHGQHQWCFLPLASEVNLTRSAGNAQTCAVSHLQTYNEDLVDLSEQSRTATVHNALSSPGFHRYKYDYHHKTDKVT